MRSRAALAALVLLSACDSVEPVEGQLLVSTLPPAGVVPVPQLVLESEPVAGCVPALAVDTESGAGRLDVTVRGVSSGDTSFCPDGQENPAYVFVLFPEGPRDVTVQIRHDGSDDRYRYTCAGAECSLASVRTSTTRLATP